MSKTDTTYEWIKEKIISGEYSPLQDLSEDAIQKELGVSRTPVREALLRLEKEDFIYVYPRKGTIVTDVTRDLIDEIYEVRLLNEPYIAVRVMNLLDRDWLEDIRLRLKQPPAHLTQAQLRTYHIQLDTELHSTMINRYPNRYLRRIMKAVFEQNQRIRMVCSHPGQGIDHSPEEHLEIVTNILEGDPEKVRKSVVNHIKQSRIVTNESFR